MTKYSPDFKQPPWVMGSPKEVMDWIDASHPSKKEKKGRKSDRERGREVLKNLHIKFDFDVAQTKIRPSNVFSRLFLKITGNEMVEEDFDLIPTSELILRALAKAKFRNTVKIVADGKTLYDHPEKTSDIRKTIDGLSGFSNNIMDGRTIEITAILADVEKCTAKIKIKKIHSKKEHSVDIQMKGEIKKELYHTFLNYLDEKLGIKEPA